MIVLVLIPGFTRDEVIKISTVLASKDADAIKLSKNLIDEIWLDRPPVPLGLLLLILKFMQGKQLHLNLTPLTLK